MTRIRVAPPFFALLLITGAFPASGQTAPAVEPDRSAWLYKGSDIAPDPAWHFGTLPNGLRYAVRRNGVPPGQVSVRVRIDAGSLQEEDSEQGFAHLIEHLSFRGSEFVPDGEAKRVWQRLGATFGTDSNAQTTPTATIYKLDLPSATPDGLAESLKILAGMMAHPAIVQTALDAERPVVLAEQREQPGPQVRFGDKVRETMFAGQRLATRSTIGSIQMLQAATPASVRAFHDRWYRPERTVVILSGDFDPAVLEKQVVEHFSSWKGVGPSPVDPDFGKPDPSQPVSGALVEPGLPGVVQMAMLRPWHFNNDTILFNQKRLVDTLATFVINRRLESRARAGGSFLQASVTLDDMSRSANGTFVTIMPVGDQWEAALKDVRGVIADAQAAPPSQAEVDRELAEYESAMKVQADTAAAEAGSKQADDLVEALDIRETVTSAATALSIVQQAKAQHMFTPAAVLTSTRRIFGEGVTRAIVNTPVADPNAAAELAAALKTEVKGVAETRAAGRRITFAALPKLGQPGKVVSRAPVADLDMEKVQFANGVRLLVFASPSESNRVYVRVRFGAGLNGLPADRPTPAWAAELALVASGIGKLGQEDLDRLTAGRQLGLDFDLGEDAFSYSAITSPTDMADELRLIATKMAMPGWDPNPVLRAKAVTLASYAGMSASPDGVLASDLDRLTHNGDPRWGLPAKADVDALTPQAFRAFWEPLLKTGPIEVQVFGDIKPDTTIAAVAASLGTLPPRSASTVPPAPIAFPAHVATPVVRYHDGQDNQAAAVIAWPTGSGIAGITESRRLDVLAQIFSDRLFEGLRSAQGASYSPNVSSQWPIGLDGGGKLVAMGKVAPDHVDFFLKTARDIAADLVAHPVSADELQRLLGPMAQNLLRISTGSQFWMQQTAGGAFDPRRIAALRTLASDISGTTPADIQAVAKRYLLPDKDWTMVVLPRAKGVSASR